MSKNNLSKNILIKELLKASAYAVAIYSLLILITYFLEVHIVMNLEMIFSIIASVSGVAYIITIRNPQNYLGFYIGIIMSLFLALQFMQIKSYDLTILYIFIFIPLQIKSIIEWKNAWKIQQDSNIAKVDLRPKFLSPSKMLLAFVAFLVITILDIVVLKYIMNSTSPILTIVSSAIMLGTSILANYLMIYKKIDVWVYWVFYSISGIVFALQINNQFNIILFISFLILNTYTGIIWYKNKA